MTRWRRPPALVVAVSAVTLSLCACSSTHTPTTSPSTATTASKASPGGTRTTAPEGGATSKSALPGGAAGVIPASVPDQDRVRPDVDLINCTPTEGGWSAGGTVKNSLHHATTYLITVFFTSAQATDLAAATTSVHLLVGQAKLWSTQASFPAPAQVLCLLRGVAAS